LNNWELLVTGRKRSLAVAVGALLAAAIVQASPAAAIANGQDVPDGAYRFSVALSMPKITQSNGVVRASACSAALIDPQWIITAGHCLHDGDRHRVSGPPRYQVIATIGQATLSGTTGTKVDLVDVAQSPTSDMAIAKLATPVRGVKPLALSTKAPAAGDILRLVGWGDADATGDLTHRPDRMQTGQFKVTSADASQVYVAGYRPTETTSACPFDSGAPYFAETPYGSPRLVATEVSGPDCPHAGDETTARIDVLHDWICQELADHKS
jgi:hypothetical protein